MKRPKKVDVNRGLNCTKDMAMSHLDQLVEEINQANIGELAYVEPECGQELLIFQGRYILVQQDLFR